MSRVTFGGLSRVAFGGLLAFVLLGLFVYAVVLTLIVAHDCQESTCSLSDGLAFLLETLGALVSAVVVSELAVTKPTEVPGTRLATAYHEDREKKIVKAFASFYIVVWLISGVALVILGWVQNSKVPQLATVAKEWLGVAIAAAYAYFGISPQ